jgi:hypothetical protein
MKKISVVECSGCGKSFEKQTKYVNQSAKRGMDHYCSRSCHGRHTGKNNFSEEWNNSEENKQNLKKICINRADDYTPFRTIFRSCFKRNKECDLDLPYLKELWESQDGKCAVTGVALVLKQSHNKNYQASLDRIDSTKGYVKGNVRYTSVSINWLKSNLTDEHLEEFISICKESGKNQHEGIQDAVW